LRQIAHLACNDGKASSLLSGPSRLNGGVQRQDIGLEHDAVDHSDNVDNLLGRLIDRAHRVHHLHHDSSSFARDIRCRYRQLIGLAGVVRILVQDVAVN
jgi:hypothetical protein